MQVPKGSSEVVPPPGPEALCCHCRAASGSEGAVQGNGCSVGPRGCVLWGLTESASKPRQVLKQGGETLRMGRYHG